MPCFKCYELSRSSFYYLQSWQCYGDCSCPNVMIRLLTCNFTCSVVPTSKRDPSPSTLRAGSQGRKALLYRSLLLMAVRGISSPTSPARRPSSVVVTPGCGGRAHSATSHRAAGIRAAGRAPGPSSSERAAQCWQHGGSPRGSWTATWWSAADSRRASPGRHPSACRPSCPRHRPSSAAPAGMNSRATQVARAAPRARSGVGGWGGGISLHIPDLAAACGLAFAGLRGGMCGLAGGGVEICTCRPSDACVEGA